LPESIYAQFRGPQYETPAEIKMARIIGADLAGMSTGLEAIAAREQGLETIGLSLVTNYAAGINPIPLSHEEVLETGKQAQVKMHSLLTQICNVI
jgi:purine-nucleoside phosphorylase